MLNTARSLENSDQTRLEIGTKYEQEADRVADHVMRTPGDSLRMQPMEEEEELMMKCEYCEEDELHMKPGLQLKSDQAVDAPSELSSQIKSTKGSGTALAPDVRQEMSSKIGADFSGVNIHTNANAVQMNRQLGARAFTQGNDIYFNKGEFNPSSSEGKHLLAHELTHVVQQGGSSSGTLQRTIGDGHDLTSARFSGNTILEAVYDGERLLRRGSRGNAVIILQKALMDAGFPLQQFGADGKFGEETENAVEEFQRHSGLSGTDVDGIVGPVSMGWLDQRFSAGPTPAGTGSGATTGCANIKTVTVDIVSLDGSTRDATNDFEVANTIFNQCCVRFTVGIGVSATPTQTSAWLNGDTDIASSTSCTPTSEESTLFTDAGIEFGLSSRIRVFYVDTISGANFDAYSFHKGCSSPTDEMAVVSNAAGSRELAHELGHILLNQANGAHSSDADNLMADPDPGTQIDTAQCTTIFGNA